MVAEKKPEGPLPTARLELDKVLERLRAHADGFARSSVMERVAMLREFLDGYLKVAEESVAAGCKMKGIDPHSSAAGEEWLAGPQVVVRNLRLLIASLLRIAQGESTVDAEQIHPIADGRVAVNVFPTDGYDKVLMAGFTAEVWMKPGVSAADVQARAAAHYKTPVEKRQGAVSLILGAGNVAAIPPTDALYKMFVEGKVCLIKMNPVNQHVGPFIERAFKAGIDAGVLAVCYGGGDVGAYLVEHPSVDEIHITGSDKTHDLMVWGPPGPEREERKAKKQPKLHKQITSELGNVSPVIVVPGPYSDGEIAWQGESIAAAIANNASFNCNAAKLLVQPKGWSGREKLRKAINATLETIPPRRAYYPGAEQRWTELTGSHTNVERIGKGGPDTLPWAIIPDVDAKNTDDKVFHMEPWCSVLSETAIGSQDPAAFLDEAVRFVNDHVWGTLSVTVIIHPSSLKDPKVAEALDRAIRELRYGTVCINHWPALGFAFGSTPWGGHPSATLEDIQSGRGWVHNTYLINDDDIEKVVIRGPLTVKPRPPWFATNKNCDQVARRLMQMEASPHWSRIPGLLLAALKG
jgi:aldehyde dehydrogenase (NAD(P)+)